MTDGIIKGTGNSRYLKSAIAADMTWEQYRTALRNGTIPIDLNGINAAGWNALGTSLSKANLLSSTTETTIFGDAADRTINQALAALSPLSGSGDPTTSTVGVVKQLYLNTTTKQIYQCTAIAGSVYTWTALKATTLYEKIRSITDTSASNSLSIDISDISWSTYDEIRLVGYFWASGPDVYLRINNLSDSNYKFSYMRAGSAYSSNTAMSYLYSQTQPRSTYPARFDISITKHVNNSSTYWVFRLNHIGTYSDPTTGISEYGISVATLSSINFVCASTPYTVNISGVSLWGMKK